MFKVLILVVCVQISLLYTRYIKFLIIIHNVLYCHYVRTSLVHVYLYMYTYYITLHMLYMYTNVMRYQSIHKIDMIHFRHKSMIIPAGNWMIKAQVRGVQ